MMRHGLAVLALVVVARAVQAQSIEGSATMFMVQSHTRFANTLAEQTGGWVSGEGAVRLSKLQLRLAAAMGSLSGTSDALHPDRSGRTTSITAAVLPTPWLSLGGTAEAKRFDSDLGATVWRLIGANIVVTPPLDANLRGLVDVSYWPSASVLGGENMSLAFRATIGATYDIPGTPLSARLAYRFERFDFDAGSAARLEQFRGATFGAAYRLGR